MLRLVERQTSVELQRTQNELVRTRAERDAVQARLESVYALRWTKLGAKLRVAVKVTRAMPQAIAVATRDPRGALQSVAGDLSHGRLRSLARRIANADTPPSALEHARRLRADGEPEQALGLLNGAVAARRGDVALLAERAATYLALGELTAALSDARTVAGISPTPQRLAAEATLAGRLRELDQSWFPDLAVPPEPLDPDPRRVLHLLKESRPYHERGYTMRSHYMLRSQQQAGLDPAVVTSLGFPRLDGFPEFDSVDVLDGIAHHRLDLGPDYPYRRAPFDHVLSEYARQAARVVRQWRPAVIHASSGYRGFETALVAIALGRHFSIPVVYDIRSFLEATWTPDISRSQRGEHYERRLARELSCMRAADLVFTIAATMKADIVSRGVDPDKVVIIPNAVDPDEFRPRPRDLALAAELGLSGKHVLGYVSNIGRREGLDIFVDAIAHLDRERSDVGGLIVGDGPELAGLRNQIDSLGLTKVVVATGQVPHGEIQRYYSLIDVFVVPRRNDQAARLVTPLKPFEAMAMARPLLVADLPALVDIARPGTRGLSFTAGDPRSLAAQAAKLIDDPRLRDAFGAAGRAWVEQERTWAMNSQRYVAAYERVGVRPRGPR